MPAPTNLIAVPAMNVGATIGRPTTSPARHVRPPLQTLRRKKNPPGETGGKGGSLILFM